MDELMELEEELRQALRHVPAPDGFADRVMRRVGAETALTALERRSQGTLLRMHPVWWSAVAAALLLVVGGDALHLHLQHRAQRERAAEAQVDLALQLTSHALDQVELDVDRSPAGRWTHLGDKTQQ